MLSINEAIKKTRSLVRGSDKERSVQELVIRLQESVTKLWPRPLNEKDQEEINKRVAYTLVGVMRLAENLETVDLENLNQK